MYSLCLLLFLVDSKESSFSPRDPAPEYTGRVFAVSSESLVFVDSKASSFSPRVPAPEYTARVFAVSSLVFGGQ